MRVEWVIFCRYVEQADGGTNMLGVGMDTGRYSTLPTRVQLWAALCVAEDYHALAATSVHRITYLVRDPALREIRVRAWDTTIGMAKPDSFPQGWEGVAVIPIPVDFTAATEGGYTVVFSMDDGEPLTRDYQILRPAQS